MSQNNKPTICLNMIVKNESHVILTTLQLLSKFINYWVIVDTGSTDNTKEIITNYFNSVNIPGELHEDPWEDFDINRSKCIKRAKGKADYILVFDADDSMSGQFEIPNDNLDAYYLKFKSGYSYTRLGLFKGSLDWSYRSVVHEFPVCNSNPDYTKDTIEGNYYIISNRTGARSLQENKYLNDANRMIARYDSEPDMRTRYSFYIAQSFYDHGDFKQAKKWYEKRIKRKDGWNEEVYFSHYKIALCKEKLRVTEDIVEYIEEIIESYKKASKILPDRIEPYYSLGIFIRKFANEIIDEEIRNCILNIGKSAFLQGSTIKLKSKHGLFVDYEVCEWKNLYEACLIHFENENFNQVILLCDEILNDFELKENTNVRLKFETLKMKSLIKLQNNDTDMSQILSEINKTLLKRNEINLQLLERGKIIQNKISIVITNYISYDSFSSTINSFIKNCLNYNLICEWYVIDDKHDYESNNLIRDNYPFIKIITKDKNDVDFILSLNLIKENIKAKYLLLLPCGWKFIEKRNYILDCIHFIENISCNNISQVIFNRNNLRCVDDLNKENFMGSVVNHQDKKYIFNDKNYGFYFVPSIISFDVISKLSEFENVINNEITYSNIYKNAGMKSYSIDIISCYYSR